MLEEENDGGEAQDGEDSRVKSRERGERIAIRDSERASEGLGAFLFSRVGFMGSGFWAKLKIGPRLNSWAVYLLNNGPSF